MGRKRKKENLRPYVPPESFPRPTADELVDEGLLIAISGVRLAVTNQAIVRALRDHEDFDLRWYRAAVREQLQLVEQQTIDDADRVVDAIDHVVEKPPKGAFRPYLREPERLDLRREMLLGLVTRLHDLSADETYVEDLALASRDAALDEIAAAITATALRAVAPVTPVTGAEREMELASLGMELHLLAGGSPEL